MHLLGEAAVGGEEGEGGEEDLLQQGEGLPVERRGGGHRLPQALRVIPAAVPDTQARLAQPR